MRRFIAREATCADKYIRVEITADTTPKLTNKQCHIS